MRHVHKMHRPAAILMRKMMIIYWLGVLRPHYSHTNRHCGETVLYIFILYSCHVGKNGLWVLLWSWIWVGNTATKIECVDVIMSCWWTLETLSEITQMPRNQYNQWLAGHLSWDHQIQTPQALEKSLPAITEEEVVLGKSCAREQEIPCPQC